MLHATAPVVAGAPVVWVATPQLDAPSETFVRAHIARLPAAVKVLSDSYLQLPGDVIARALRASRAELLLAEHGQTGVAVMAAAQAAGVRLVVHFHGCDAYQRVILERHARSYHELFEQAAAIIAVSRDMERQLVRLGAPANRVAYVPCGVDSTAFCGGDPATAPPLLLAVGRFVPKKGQLQTLRAFAIVAEQCAEARLVLIGEGPLRDAALGLAAELGLAERVRFLGRRSHAEVAAALRGARALVQHSLRAEDGDCEGTPLSVLEAGACGLPVIATRHGGIPDVVLDGLTGLLVDEHDIEAMAAQMVRLCEQPELAATLGRAAQQRVRTAFSQERQVGRLWRIMRGAAHDR